jgi:hypothetical protein
MTCSGRSAHRDGQRSSSGNQSSRSGRSTRVCPAIVYGRLRPSGRVQGLPAISAWSRSPAQQAVRVSGDLRQALGGARWRGYQQEASAPVIATDAPWSRGAAGAPPPPGARLTTASGYTASGWPRSAGSTTPRRRRAPKRDILSQRRRSYTAPGPLVVDQQVAVRQRPTGRRHRHQARLRRGRAARG